MAKEFGRSISSLDFLFFDLRNKRQQNNMKSSTKMEPIAIPTGIAILPWSSMYVRIKYLSHSQENARGVREIYGWGVIPAGIKRSDEEIQDENEPSLNELSLSLAA